MRNFLKFTCVAFISLCAKAQVPTATILSSSGNLCTDVPSFFAAKNANSPTTFTWSWSLGKGASFVTDNHDSSVVCLFTQPGIFVLNLTVANGTLSSVSSKTLSVTRSAVASFNASLTTAGFPAELSLTNYSSNSLKNYWLYSNSAQKDSANYLLKPYGASGSYTVTLVALGKLGCNDTLSYAFRVSDSSGVTLPNIFSPNNDEVNDVFRPITRGISSLKAWVYNRYGALIASWDRVNGSWDGHTTSGLECMAGEYFIIVQATGFDGKSYKLKSTITLVR